MSTGTLPQYIDAPKWADREAVIEEIVPLQSFARLCEGAASVEGEVSVACRIYRDTQGLIVLQGKLATSMQLVCQRCLEPVAVTVDADIQLRLLRNEEQAERLADDADYLLQDEEGRIALADVLEDELILSLPLVALHDDCEPQAVNVVDDESAEVETPVRENPFQVLAGLKGSTEK